MSWPKHKVFPRQKSLFKKLLEYYKRTKVKPVSTAMIANLEQRKDNEQIVNETDGTGRCWIVGNFVYIPIYWLPDLGVVESKLGGPCRDTRSTGFDCY